MTSTLSPSSRPNIISRLGSGLKGVITPQLPEKARPWNGAAGQLGLLAVMFLFYLAVRGLTQTSEDLALRNAYNVLRFETGIGIAWERSAQQVLLDRSNLMAFFNWIYVWTYWPMLVGSLVLLWWRDKPRYLLFRDALIFSGAIGLVVFALYPVAPPRFLNGFVDTVSATSRHVIAHPPAIINQFAALPSFHVGWHTLAALMIASMVSAWFIRVLIMLPSAMMAISVVVTANHYIVDAAAGMVLSLVGLALIAKLRSRGSAVATSAQPLLRRTDQQILE